MCETPSNTETLKLEHEDYVWAATRRLTMVLGGTPHERHLTVSYRYWGQERGLSLAIADATSDDCSDNIEVALKLAIDELRSQEEVK